MARGTVTCTCKKCGATFTKTKYCGNRRDADSWETWAASHITLCDDCREAERKEKLAEKLSDCAALSGSEKQIAWADSIRLQFLNGVADAIESTDEEYRPLLDQVINYIKSITSASWWIDHRNFGVSSNLANMVLAENPEVFQDGGSKCDV